MNNTYLLYIAQDYSFEILRPLQQEIIARGEQALWFVYGKEVSLDKFRDDEQYTCDARAAIAFNPTATFVPGNMVPSFIPGLKVQVFHGLEWKKKGHFVIRGCFDLYCTHGAATTGRFEVLAKQYGYFTVVETGWPKLDPLFSSSPYQWDNKSDNPIILFAPTFSPALTAAPELFEHIKLLVEQHDWQWLVKFHPKMDPQWVAKYKQIVGDNYQVIEDEPVAGLLQAADILISDTSSIIGEFSLLGKPVITLNNSQPGQYLIDIATGEALVESINTALAPNDILNGHIAAYADALHPYQDGAASARILDAVQDMVEGNNLPVKKKPLNLFRNLKIRKKLNYWKV